MATDFKGLLREIREHVKAEARSPLGVFLLLMSAAGLGIIFLAKLVSESAAGNYLLALLNRWSAQPIGHVTLYALGGLIAWIALWWAVAVVAAIVQTRPNWAKAKAERSALKQEVADLTRELGICRPELIALDRMMRYGSRFPKFGDLTDVDRGIAVNVALHLGDQLKRATDAAERVWGQLGAWVEMDANFSLLYKWVHGNDHSHVGASIIWLDRDLRAAQDPRPLLCVAYMAYHRWRTWMVRLHGVHAINDSPHYVRWHEADKAFQSEFVSAVKNTTQLAHIREVLEQFHANEGVEISLPPPAGAQEHG